MAWTSTIFSYCERGLDPGLWAEPLNVASSLAFFATAAYGMSLWRVERGSGRTGLVLIALTACIGAGSAAFHAVAMPLAQLADIIPIGLFMLAYLGFALHRLVGLGRAATGAGIGLFVLAIGFASRPLCAGGPCLNGSAAYLPALAALIVVAAVLHLRRHPAAAPLLLAAALLVASLVFRTADRLACPYTIVVAARSIGTHFLWHLLNAAMIAVLLRAAILHKPPAGA